ncbi:MAG: AbrB/MazE/SpoVT family DNA-binding domain-containing protein [Moraxella sp.]|nr:AbrB/MazE/SpoVT family DNA-binding domain-containing protein [Moraxella sp.]
MLTRVFQSGNSQAVRIPADFRLTVDTVEIIKADNGDLILRQPTPQKGLGDELFELFTNFDDDVIRAIEDRDNEPPQEREAL